MAQDFPKPGGSAPSTDDAALVARRSRIAGPAAAAFGAPYDPDRPEPEPGQVWRLEWDGRVELAALVAVTADNVTVVPVGDDPEFADPATVVLDAGDSPLGYSLGLWVALEQVLPRVVLDLPLGALPAWATDLVAGVRRSIRGSSPLPVDRRLGAPLPRGAGFEHPVLAYRHEVQQRLTALAEVWSLFDAPEPAPPRRVAAAAEAPPFYRLERAGGQQPGAAAGAGALWRILTERGLADRAAEVLSLSRQERVSASRGRLPLTPEEVSKVASLLGAPTEEVAAMVTQVDPRLLVVLHEPRRRAQVARKAVELGVSGTEARRKVVREVVGAPRRERAGGETDWNAVLDAYFGDQG